MLSLIRSLGLLSALLDAACAINIFVSHYQGTVQSLTLTPTSGGGYTLVSNGTVTIGGQPSWMTYDSANRIIYVADENTPTGGITSITAAPDGSLKQLGHVSAPGGGVANVLYGGGYIATAH
jgi:6-phosphogluconolactonase (cycloisomerase 2 family)